MRGGLASEKPPHAIFVAFLEEKGGFMMAFPLNGGPRPSPYGIV